MPADPNGTATSAQKPQKERWSLLSVSFGAVTGAVLSILLQPLVDRLPGRLFEEFLNTAVEDALPIVVFALCTFAAARIRRLDQFLQRFLVRATLAASALLAFSLWLRTGTPPGVLPVSCIVVTGLECWLFLLFCGGAMRTGLMQIEGTQEDEYKEEREAEASETIAQAMAEGDPMLAAGAFATNTAGEVGAANRKIVFLLLLCVFHSVAIVLVAAADARLLFKLSIVWSWIAGVILLLAAIFAAVKSQEFGELYSARVPLIAKYTGILPDREGGGKTS